MKLTDAAGVEHRAAGGQPRIVSLVPSVTELLCELGLADRLVGRTGFCIHPADTVRAIAKVGGTKDVNIEKIRRLAPTHLVVNIDENEKPTVDALAVFIPNVIVTHPLAPRDTWRCTACSAASSARRTRPSNCAARSSGSTRRWPRCRRCRRAVCCTASGRIRG